MEPFGASLSSFSSFQELPGALYRTSRDVKSDKSQENQKTLFFGFNTIKMQLSTSPIVLAWSQALVPVYICVKSRFTVFGSVFGSVFACLGNI